MHPATLGALRESGLSVDEAATTVGELLATLVIRAELGLGPTVVRDS